MGFFQGFKAKVEKVRQDAFVKKFVADNPHLSPYFESGEANRAYLKEAEKILDENPGITQLELMEKAGGIVADRFRKADEAKRAAVAKTTGGRASA